MHERIVLLLGISCLAKSQDLQCDVQGICDGSFITIDEGATYNECLVMCNRNVECNWFTYHATLGNCLLFRDCILDPSCDTCHSGQSACLNQIPECNKYGFCNGNPVAINSAASVHECLEECQAFETCNWFTYYSSSENCIMTADCTDVQGCPNCVHGEKQCQN